jgi:uncharacterized protein (DUF3084 family)
LAGVAHLNPEGIVDEKKNGLQAVPQTKSISEVTDLELKGAIYDQSKQLQMIQNAINALENELMRREQLKRQRPAIAVPSKDKPDDPATLPDSASVPDEGAGK